MTTATSATCGSAHNGMIPAVTPIRAVHWETHDTFTLRLAPPPGYAFQPGQFNMLYVYGVGEAAISLSGSAEDSKNLTHTIRRVGSVTGALAKLKPGDALGVRGPFGSVWPIDACRGQDVVLVSGGIGLAPLRPVIYHLLQHRTDFGRVILLQGARTPRDLLYAPELEAWGRRPDLHVLVTVDQADASWSDAVGVVTRLFDQVDLDPARTLGLLCGPEIMMRYAVREFVSRGIAKNKVYVSMERNMQCAIGLCGHCQFGPSFVCMDGPVFRYDRIENFFNLREA